jgi:hypothetical protein
MSKVPLLITTCIHSSAPLTLLNDDKERLNAVISGLEQLSKYVPSELKLVICDGSGYDFYDEKYKLQNLFKNLEVISFNNNIELTQKMGKGYGEGEIVNYALKNSVFLTGADTFAKLTGKLWLVNLNQCLNEFNGAASFIFDDPYRPQKVDTRFYIINKEIYYSTLSSAHETVDDNNGKYLEHCFFERIHFNNANLRLVSANSYPVIYGVSGSTGMVYKPSVWKCYLKSLKYRLEIRIASLLNYWR